MTLLQLLWLTTLCGWGAVVVGEPLDPEERSLLQKTLEGFIGASPSWSSYKLPSLDEECAFYEFARHGFECTDGRVTSLFLPRRNFSGSVAPSLANLTELSVLDISDNQLTGTLPTDLGRLTKLKEINVANNRLFGHLPASLSNLLVMRNGSLESCALNVAEGERNGFCCTDTNPLESLCVLDVCRSPPACLEAGFPATEVPPSVFCKNLVKDPLEDGVDCGPVCLVSCNDGKHMPTPPAGDSDSFFEEFDALLHRYLWMGPVIFGGATLLVCGTIMAVFFWCMYTRIVKQTKRVRPPVEMRSSRRQRHGGSTASVRRRKLTQPPTDMGQEYSKLTIARDSESLESTTYAGVSLDLLKRHDASTLPSVSGYGVIPESGDENNVYDEVGIASSIDNMPGYSSGVSLVHKNAGDPNSSTSAGNRKSSRRSRTGSRAVVRRRPTVKHTNSQQSVVSESQSHEQYGSIPGEPEKGTLADMLPGTPGTDSTV